MKKIYLLRSLLFIYYIKNKFLFLLIYQDKDNFFINLPLTIIIHYKSFFNIKDYTGERERNRDERERNRGDQESQIYTNSLEYRIISNIYSLLKSFGRE